MTNFFVIFIEQTILLSEVPCYPRTSISRLDLRHSGNKLMSRMQRN